MIADNLFGDKTYVVENLFANFEKEGYELSLKKHEKL